MCDFIEQKHHIKFCLRNKNSCAKTSRRLQRGFGKQNFQEINVCKWYKLFKEGRERAENEKRPGQPSISTNESHVKQIKDFVLKNRRLTVSELTDAVGTSKGPINNILKNILGLKSI